MHKLDTYNLQEILTLLHSAEIANFTLLEYRLTIIQACSLLNQQMVRGQSLQVTQAYYKEYARLSQAYSVISKSFDAYSKAYVKETLISAIMNVLYMTRTHTTVTMGNAYAS